MSLPSVELLQLSRSQFRRGARVAPWRGTHGGSRRHANGSTPSRTDKRTGETVCGALNRRPPAARRRWAIPPRERVRPIRWRQGSDRPSIGKGREATDLDGLPAPCPSHSTGNGFGPNSSRSRSRDSNTKDTESLGSTFGNGTCRSVTNATERSRVSWPGGEASTSCGRPLPSGPSSKRVAVQPRGGRPLTARAGGAGSGEREVGRFRRRLAPLR